MKKKTIFVIFLSIVALVVLTGVTVVLCNHASQSELYIEPEGEKTVGPLPIISEKNDVVLAPGLRFRIDSGSSFSTISRKQLQLLDSMGYAVDSMYTLSMGLGYRSQFRVVTKRYRVTLPVYSYDFGTPDSTGIYPEPVMNVEKGPVCKFVNVDFAMVLNNEHAVPLLGIDFLEKFVLQMSYYPHTVTFRTEVPEGFDYVGEMIRANTFKDFVWVGSRYYLDMTVNHVDDRYLVDTGLERAPIKAPTYMRPRHRNKDRHDGTVTSVGNNYTAVVDGNVWVEFGNRAVGSATYYYEDEDEAFAINPLNFFRWEAVLDFTNCKVYTTRKRSKIQSSSEK